MNYNAFSIQFQRPKVANFRTSGAACKVCTERIETIIIIFYNKDTTIIILFLEIFTIITIVLIIIIDNGIQDSIKTLTQDSSKIEINHMKIDFYKIITLNKIQIIQK